MCNVYVEDVFVTQNMFFLYYWHKKMNTQHFLLPPTRSENRLSPNIPLGPFINTQTYITLYFIFAVLFCFPYCIYRQTFFLTHNIYRMATKFKYTPINIRVITRKWSQNKWYWMKCHTQLTSGKLRDQTTELENSTRCG